MRIITVRFECRSTRYQPFMRVLLQLLHFLDYISANFALKTVVQKVKLYNDSKVTVLDGKEDN